MNKKEIFKGMSSNLGRLADQISELWCAGVDEQVIGDITKAFGELNTRVKMAEISVDEEEERDAYVYHDAFDCADLAREGERT